MDWRTVARYAIEPPGTPGRSETRWTASASIQGFEPNRFRDYGATETDALSNLLTYIRGRDPKQRTDLPDDIMGILADDAT